MPTPTREIQYLETISAYDQWAEVYDTDNNFLQRLDTLELQTLLPAFLSLVQEQQHEQEQQTPTKIVDLGCGTGRNTLSLLRATAPAPEDPANTPPTQILGLEPSTGMLAVARTKVEEYFTNGGAAAGDTRDRVFFLEYNIAPEGGAEPPALAQGADGVVSTLVLEHVELAGFFGAVAAMLRAGGVALVTNLHAEMSAVSQAGFVQPATGVKIRPTRCYAYTVAQTLAAAAAAGLQPVAEVRETRVSEELAAVLGPRATKWIGVYVWYACCFRKM
ncbi:hypothetical protein LOZ52_006691 [Ophidiomyces ophidiicola]|nr:hypothetical protein LOZ49_006658 [Ophidiomyces ophidiicola]KAI2420523.1 hypothetical protein LOZ52_006691 [Ophidiomyces ophidiicola]KAI2453130.1 hypothetical protein LOY97_006225 [Ophidiomyces ophidiicola]